MKSDMKPADFEELLKFLQAEGYEIKRGSIPQSVGKSLPKEMKKYRNGKKQNRKSASLIW